MPEEDAFCVFVSLMKDYRLRELYKPSMADLSVCFHILEKALEELFPNLYLHFRAVVRALHYLDYLRYITLQYVPKTLGV
jgi:hypothetical protein